MSAIAIIGCGPAGLLAAHAVVLRGHMPVIFSPKQKSVIHGAQYLHHPILDLTSQDPDGMLTYRKVGTKEGYATKVYGSPTARCSWDLFPEGELPAWSLLAAYDDLWELYSGFSGSTPVGPAEMEAIKSSFQVVINTAPAPHFCERQVVSSTTDDPLEPEGHEHVFEHSSIYTVPWAPLDMPDMTIEYRGTPVAPPRAHHHDERDVFYRHSKIFGHAQSEASAGAMGGAAIIAYPDLESQEKQDTSKLKVVKADKGRKPTYTSCDCQKRAGIIQQGRFGKWEKGVLVHQVFEEVYSALQ